MPKPNSTQLRGSDQHCQGRTLLYEVGALHPWKAAGSFWSRSRCLFSCDWAKKGRARYRVGGGYDLFNYGEIAGTSGPDPPEAQAADQPGSLPSIHWLR
jgi:hypothetical protein